VMGAHDPEASACEVSFLNCARCGLSLRPRAGWLTIEHCPRWMARARIPITLSSSPLPTIELHCEGFAPGARSPATDQASRAPENRSGIRRTQANDARASLPRAVPSVRAK
jgi:hypothetical protein